MKIKAVCRAAPVIVALMLTSQASAGVKEGVEKWQAGDYKAAVVEWLPYAAKGDPDALFNLGQAYKLGRGVPMDKAKAEDFYRRAADKGHAPAQSNLGIVLAQRGEKAAAVELWRKAAAKDEARAQYMLGVLYFNGDTVDKNWPLAYAYMLQANDAGLPQAARALSTMNGSLSPDDRAKGTELAASLGGSNRLAQSGKPVAAAQNTAKDDATKPAAPKAPPATAPAPVRTAQAVTPIKLSTPPAPTQSPAPAQLRSTAPPRTTVASAAVPSPTAANSDDGKWRVQLGAYSQEARAREAWNLLRREQPGIVGNESAFYVPAGNVTRLQVGSFAESAAATVLCQRLKAIGRACFIVEAN